MPELGTMSPSAVPNWLQSSLKPRAQLYMEVASDCDDHWLRIDKDENKISKVQGGQYSGSGIKF